MKIFFSAGRKMGQPFDALEYAAIKIYYLVINLKNLSKFLVSHEMPITV